MTVMKLKYFLRLSRAFGRLVLLFARVAVPLNEKLQEHHLARLNNWFKMNPKQRKPYGRSYFCHRNLLSAVMMINIRRIPTYSTCRSSNYFYKTKETEQTNQLDIGQALSMTRSATLTEHTANAMQLCGQCCCFDSIRKGLSLPFGLTRTH